jgi:plastocyanin
MDNETLFYVLGIAAAVSAVVVSFVGLKVKSFPGRATPLVVLWFVILIAGATTFVVRYSQEHEEHRAHELEHASKEIEHEQTTEPFEEAEEGGAGAEEEAGGEHGEEGEAEEAGGGEAGAAEGGETIEVAADPSALAFDTDSLEAPAGEDTFVFENPSAIPHDFVIEKDGEEVGGTEVFAEGEEEFSTKLEPGDYTFLCTVPGHAAAGMEGTLTVQ